MRSSIPFLAALASLLTTSLSSPLPLTNPSPTASYTIVTASRTNILPTPTTGPDAQTCFDTCIKELTPTCPNRDEAKLAYCHCMNQSSLNCGNRCKVQGWTLVCPAD